MPQQQGSILATLSANPCYQQATGRHTIKLAAPASQPTSQPTNQQPTQLTCDADAQVKEWLESLTECIDALNYHHPALWHLQTVEAHTLAALKVVDGNLLMGVYGCVGVGEKQWRQRTRAVSEGVSSITNPS